MDRIKLLKDYVEMANPELNIELRNGIVSENALEFEKLFETGPVPNVLYRLMPNEFVHVNKGVICDPGYLSCTEDVDKFLGHIEGQHIACLKINLESPMSRINVCKRLQSHNDESEYILPRNLRLRVEEINNYAGRMQLNRFLNDVNSVTSADELVDILRIKEVTMYLLSII